MIKPVAEEKDNFLIPESYVLDNHLSEAYNWMEKTSETIFLTGKAGTGKSSLLNYFRKNTQKKYIVLAPTGLASVQVGGTTIHSFFGFPLRTMIQNDPEIRRWGKSHPKYKILQNLDTLIIDEISMVRADLLDAIDQCLQTNLNSSLPFGGKQVIFIGDVFQLAPVVVNSGMEHFGQEVYESPYFFSAHVFRRAGPKILELKKIYRQEQNEFIYILNKIRDGAAGNDEISELNKRVQNESLPESEFAVCLTTVNALADKVNQEKLDELISPLFKFDGKREGNFNEKSYPVEMVLQLKRGAQIMMAKNDLMGRWVNGSIGKIISLNQKSIQVEFQNGTVHTIDSVVWENKSYKWEEETKNIVSETVGTFTQYPIKLAWAITIHKSQGLTFEKVTIDLGKGAFVHGQLYVALSRCKTWEGILLKKPVKLSDIIVDDAVEYFASKFL